MKDKLKEIAAALKSGGSVEHAVNALLKLAGEDEPKETPPVETEYLYDSVKGKLKTPPVAKKK